MSADRLFRRALERGDLPVSRAALRAAGLVAALAYAPTLVRDLFGTLRVQLEQTLRTLASQGGSLETLKELVQAQASSAPRMVLGVVVPLIALLVLAVVAVGLVQTRGALLLPGRARTGTPRAVSATLGGAALLVGCLCAGAYLVSALRVWMEPLPGAAGESPLLVVLQRVAWVCAAGLLLVACLDVALVQLLWRKRQELSPAALRREARQREVSPEVRSAQRRIHRGWADS